MGRRVRRFGLTVCAMVVLSGSSCLPDCLVEQVIGAVVSKNKAGDPEPGFGFGSDTRADEKNLEEIFTAIQKNDLAKFKRNTITTADIMLKKMQVSPFEAQQSYIGSVLRPEESRRLNDVFYTAVKGGDDFIDFKNAEFVGIGSLLDSGQSELLEGGFYEYRAYSIRVKVFGKDVVTDELLPVFIVTPWEGEVRLVGLSFSGGVMEPPDAGNDDYPTPPDNYDRDYQPPAYEEPEPEPYPPVDDYREEAPYPPVNDYDN